MFGKVFAMLRNHRELGFWYGVCDTHGILITWDLAWCLPCRSIVRGFGYDICHVIKSPGIIVIGYGG